MIIYHLKFKEREKVWLVLLWTLQMDLLLKTVLLRTLTFFLMTFLSAWLFVQVEDTEKVNSKEKYKLLHSLYESMASKYNITIEEFYNFSSMAHEALSEHKPHWTYFAAYEFVISAVTTIGKKKRNSL